MITVTKTYLPPIEKYNQYLKLAWEKGHITNRGELAISLENKIKDYLNSAPLLLTTNGTLPLQIALKVVGNNGEIITTPFSYIATSSAIIWENCQPVFVDIDEDHLTIDENKIEQAITSKTTAILATHVFGNPCHIERIEEIAHKHKLTVIYDAAHCFGVQYKGQSIFNYGDVSTCSFHATKIFHSGEGGALFCKDKTLYDKLYYSHNFGHNGPLEFHGLGINAKISELQAAMGLAVLDDFETIASERNKVVNYYNENINFDHVKTIQIRANTQWNSSYYPLIFKDEKTLLQTLEALAQENIFPRRYFYPSLNTVPYINGGSMPISESIASRIICLPLYVGLTEEQQQKIINIIHQVTNN